MVHGIVVVFGLSLPGCSTKPADTNSPPDDTDLLTDTGVDEDTGDTGANGGGRRLFNELWFSEAAALTREQALQARR